MAENLTTSSQCSLIDQKVSAYICSELVINQELARTGARGYGDGLNSGMVIGLPPVLVCRLLPRVAWAAR